MAVSIQLLKKNVYQRGVIACRKCHSPINVYKLKPLPDQFSVRCPQCEDRGHYFKRELAMQELPERRKKPRD